METRKFASSVNVLLGLYLVASPFIWGFADVPRALWNDVIVGLAVAALALVRFFRHESDWPAWANLVLGIWLFFAPFTLGYADAFSFAMDSAVGVAIALISVVSLLAEREPRDLEREVFAGTEPEERDRR